MLKFLLNRKVNLVALIIVAHLLFSYYYFPWFYSALAGTLLIVALSWLTWKKDFIFWLGFQLKMGEVCYLLLAFIGFLVGSYFLVKVVARNQNVNLLIGNYKNFIHTFFYTLNEEIVLGALFLKGIQHFRKKTAHWMISVGVALCFTIIHFVFFKWIFDNRGSLGVFTLLSLLAVGIARNNLILRTGHIGYSWALHFGWVYIMLGSSHYQRISQHYLTDFERFEVYLGDFRVMAVCFALAIFTFMNFKKLLLSDNHHSVAKW